MKREHVLTAKPQLQQIRLMIKNLLIFPRKVSIFSLSSPPTAHMHSNRSKGNTNHHAVYKRPGRRDEGDNSTALLIETSIIKGRTYMTEDATYITMLCS